MPRLPISHSFPETRPRPSTTNEATRGLEGEGGDGGGVEDAISEFRTPFEKTREMLGSYGYLPVAVSIGEMLPSY